ncbi:WD40 repeat-like protein [Rhizopogon salebrosus TDB-379]|nr:WD40 repeat-like protein [Rhizopogon salebrosus TDB-379]
MPAYFGSSTVPKLSLIYLHLLIPDIESMNQSISPIRSIRGHTDSVQEVTFSNYRNQLRVVSTSSDTTVRIWDVETGNQVGIPLERHSSATVGIAVSMDGRRIVSGDNDGKIIMWDADTKNIIRALSHHTGMVGSIRFSPDEKRIASTSYDGTLTIWDVETGELVFEIDGHQSRIGTVAYSPNGMKIASGSADGTVRIWSAMTGKQQAQPLVHRDDAEVRSVVWSPDGRLLISACDDGQIYFWSAPTGAQLGSPLHAHSNYINLLAISPSGELIASASGDNTVRLWNTTTRKPFGRVLQHSRDVGTVAFSPNGQLVATGSVDDTIYLWDISRETVTATNTVSPSFLTSASNPMSDLGQASESATSVSHLTSPTPALAGFGQPDGIEFHSGSVRSSHSATSPSLPSQGYPTPGILAASSSAPALATPSKSFWKRFFMLDRSSASVGTSKRRKIPRIDNIL